MDQVFAERQVSEKYLENEKDGCIGHLWIWKSSYDTIDQHAMWQMLREYGVGKSW